MTRDLHLSNDATQLLAIKGQSLLKVIQLFPGIDEDRKNSVHFFTEEESIVYCHEVNVLMIGDYL